MAAVANQAYDENELATRYLKSPTFAALYQDTMGFIRELAAYLDGPGRAQSKALSRSESIGYVAMSQQLTAGAMRVASILLTLRSIRDGETSFTSGIADLRSKDTTKSPESSLMVVEGMPTELLDYVRRCDDLRLEALRMLDSLMAEPMHRPNQVHATLDVLSSAFGRAK